MKRLAVLGLSAALVGCATAPPPPKTVPDPIIVPVDKPVPVPCVAATFPTSPPAFPDTREARLAAADPAEDYNLLAAGWPLKEAWIKSLWDQVNACR